MRPNPRPARKPSAPPPNRLSPEAVFQAGRTGGSGGAGTPRPEVGPRPLSPTQRALLEAKNSPPAPPQSPVLSSPARTGRGRAVHVRDGQTSRTTRRVNRRRRNWGPLLLGWATGIFVVECIAALLFSPRFLVRQVTVEGNRQIGTARVLALAQKLTGLNIVRLPTGKVRAQLLTEPTLETVEVHRVLPGTVRIVVRERQPWASVRLPDGRNVTIDAALVPFRVTKGSEAGLPRLILAAAVRDALPGATPLPPVPVVLGKPLAAPGLSEVSRCLAWAHEQADFKLETVEIDPAGKLCLNRVGGVQIRLGSENDLEKKLKSLGLLLGRRPDLHQGTQVAYVNLYAFDAPALGMRPPAPKTTGSGTGTGDNASETTAAPDSRDAEITAPPHRAPARRTVTGRPKAG